MELNETPVRTANNFGINNISLDVNIPIVKDFENTIIITSEMDKIDVTNTIPKNKNMDSKIGLEIKQNKKIDFNIPDNTKLNEPIVIECEFDDENNNLVENININLGKDSKADFIIKIYGDEEKYFHYLKLIMNADEKSKSKIVISNMLNKISDNFIAIENYEKESAKIDYILVEFGAKNKISNYFSKLNGNNSENNLSTIYLGTNKDIIDINYNIEVYGKSSICNITAQGAINKDAHKNFKGTIDFKQGCQKSKGKENENCMILSDKAISKSLPILLCKEEDVEGEHGVSSGKIDENKLFYIMTKGISYEDSKKLIVKANFSKIINKIKNDDLQNEIMDEIDKKL